MRTAKKFHTKSSILAVLGLLLFVQACGTSENDSSLSQSDANLKSTFMKSTFMVVIGGNRSCKPNDRDEPSPLFMDMAPRTMSAIKRLQAAGQVADAMVSCFVGSNKILLSRNFSRNFSTVDPEEFVDLISQEIPSTQDKNTKLHIIGHSYGGWLAINVAAKVIELGSEIDSLVTIDPISRADCTYTNWSNCFGAPVDVPIETMANVRQKSKSWVNYFQTQTYYLHSGRIPFAHRNEQLESSHYDIDTHEVIWSQIDLDLDSIESLAQL